MGEGSDALMRGHEATGQGRDSLAKLSQITQVRGEQLMQMGQYLVQCAVQY